MLQCTNNEVFPLCMFSVNMTKSAGNCVTFTEDVFNRKLHFFCAVLKSDSHLPKKFFLLASMIALQKWWKILFISS